ncbi:MAG: hypothetical protein MUF47_06695 [Porphyrobacter sp.]|jgi:hypothetical protein|nr:hypothetical protein [Porphyrobacter sp.]
MLGLFAVGAAVAVDPALLEGLPASEVTIAFHGEQQVCTGPLLSDVTARMGAPARGEVRGAALRMVVLAEGRDGYRVLFSLGELDPLLGKAAVIVATRCNGAGLSDEDGPYRLAVAGDKRGARSLRQLASLRLATVE